MPCYIVSAHKIMSHCNSYHEQIIKKKKKNTQYVWARKWNSTPKEWLFLPFGQAWTDTANLAEMWRVMEIMAFFREKKKAERMTAKERVKD